MEYKIRYVLIGKRLERSSDFCLGISSLTNNVKVYEYEYNYDGIFFCLKNSYVLNEHGLNLEKKKTKIT